MREINNTTDANQSKDESIWLRTLKLTINLLSHIFNSLVVLICLWFSCRMPKLSIIELHIVLCVLGYQLFMRQGILVLSKFNSWSMYLKRTHRRCLHWIMELIGVILVIVGSIEVIKYKQEHFTSLHGILGLCALMTTAISVFNGILTSLAPKLPSYGIIGNSLTTANKCVHGITGIATLFLATASLHYGYNIGSFRRWVDNDNFIIILKVITWAFTVSVSFEFWIIMAKKIKYRNTKLNCNNYS